MMDGLPRGWTRCQTETIFRSFSGGTPNKSTPSYWNGSILWLSSGDIKSDRIDSSTYTISPEGLRNSSAKLCRPGSLVVVVRSGILKHTLPVAILDREAAINQDIKCMDSGDDDLNRWLAFALKASSGSILALNREGTTVQSVKYDTLKMFELSIPPAAEQKRITKKLETLLANIGTCQNRLESISQTLRHFRQSVIAAACSGRLTADWREEQSSIEDARLIVNSIQVRRQKLSKGASNAKNLDDIYSCQEEGDSESLPEGWRFVYLNKVCDSFDYGTSSKSNKEGKVPVLRMGNLQGGKIDWADLAFTSDAAEIKKYKLEGKTVLFNRTNSPELVGKTSIYRGERPAIFAGYLIRINHLPELDPEYLNYWLNSNAARKFCRQVKTDGVSQSNINAQKLGAFEVPFCSLAEQKEIVRRVEALFALADRIETRYGIAKKQVDSLTQSILAKAFRGELIPTEAELAEREGRSYESAEQLLERIRSAPPEKSVAEKNGKPKRRRHVG